MPLSYPAYLINLDRQPDRLAAFRERNGPANIDFERFPAVDGSALSDDERRLITRFDRMTPGAIGCAASHKALWERCRAMRKPIVVLEDDAWLRHDAAMSLPAVIASIGTFWDILLLGYNTDIEMRLRPGQAATPPRLPALPDEAYLAEFQRSTAVPVARRLEQAFGTCGYAVTPRGAERLLNRCIPVDLRPVLTLTKHVDMTMPRGVDVAMNALYPGIDAFVSVPPLVLARNDRETSTVKPK